MGETYRDIMGITTLTCGCGNKQAARDMHELLELGWVEVIHAHCDTCECCNFFCPDCAKTKAHQCPSHHLTGARCELQENHLGMHSAGQGVWMS